MPVIFEQNTGRVISVPDTVAAGTLQLASVEPTIDFKTYQTIISRVGVSVSGNYQFLHTIGQDVYIYVFGDRMGQVVLHGTSFSLTTKKTTGGEAHGFDLLYKWYNKNRIAAKREPVVVTIGRQTTFSGFVVALSGDAQDSIYHTISFQLTLAVLPG